MASNLSAAKADYKGVQNSAAIVAKYGNYTSYAAGWCQNFSFNDGKKGYLGSGGEWQAAYSNKTKINACMSLIGGTNITTNHYWTSTQYSMYANWGLDQSQRKIDPFSNSAQIWARAFAAL